MAFRLACGFSLAALMSVALAGQDTVALPRPILIVGGTLIDGSGGAPRHNDAILLENGRIRGIGASFEKQAPKDAERLDATGKWILPGLIDGHIHLMQTGGIDARPDQVPNPDGRPFQDIVNEIEAHPEVYLRPYLCSGITTVIDPGGPMWQFALRDKIWNDPLFPRMAYTGPMLAIAGPAPAGGGDAGGGRAAAGVPAAGGGRARGSIRLENGDPLWPTRDEATIRENVGRLAAQHPVFVKIVFIQYGDEQVKTLRATIAAIHAAKLRAAVHATTYETAMAAVDAGADILVHSVADRDIDDKFVHAVVSRKVIVAPTLVVGQNYGEVRARHVEFEPFESNCAPPKTIKSFDVLPSIPPDQGRQSTGNALPIQQRNLKRLADAGAIIYVGSDAGNTRTLHGPSLHREFALMVDAGLTPMQVLVAATKTNAIVMKREKELGQIKAGMLADVLLLDADPLTDIHNTRRVYKVIRGGFLYQP